MTFKPVSFIMYLCILVKAPLRVIYGEYSMKDGVKWQIKVKLCAISGTRPHPECCIFHTYITRKCYFSRFIVLCGRIISVISQFRWGTIVSMFLDKLGLLLNTQWCIVFKYFKYLTWCFQLTRWFSIHLIQHWMWCCYSSIQCDAYTVRIVVQCIKWMANMMLLIK